MAIVIVRATSQFHQNAVFKIRHEVFCEEEKVIPGAKNALLFDDYDQLPTNRNLLIFQNSRPCGTLRYTIDSDLGLPLDGRYDLDILRQTAPASKNALVTYFGILKKFQTAERIFDKAVEEVIHQGKNDGVENVFAVMRADYERIMCSWGFTVLDKFFCPHVNRELMYIAVNMSNFGKRQRHFDKVRTDMRIATIQLQRGERIGFSSVQTSKQIPAEVEVIRGQVVVGDLNGEQHKVLSGSTFKFASDGMPNSGNWHAFALESCELRVFLTGEESTMLSQHTA